MPCKIGQNALWYMRVMVWYKCDFTFWLGDRSLRAHKQNSPRRQTRSFTTLLAFTACLMAKHNGQRWTPREMEILDHCPVALSHFQKLFRLHPVPGGGRRDVEDLEGSVGRVMYPGSETELLQKLPLCISLQVWSALILQEQ